MKSNYPATSSSEVLTRDMTDRQRLRPMVLGRWEDLLRAEIPSVSTSPDLLVSAMEDVIGRIFSDTNRPGVRWLRQARPRVAFLHDHCQCGLQALLTYFATADQALLEAETGESEESAAILERARVLLHMLAQLEIESLCGGCPFRRSPGCVHPVPPGSRP
jgi:hypothetical protein